MSLSTRAAVLALAALCGPGCGRLGYEPIGTSQGMPPEGSAISDSDADAGDDIPALEGGDSAVLEPDASVIGDGNDAGAASADQGDGGTLAGDPDCTSAGWGGGYGGGGYGGGGYGGGYGGGGYGGGGCRTSPSFGR